MRTPMFALYQHCYLLNTLLLALPLSIFSQTHFSYTANTGNNMTVLIQSSINPSIDGTALSAGDEIGVFSPDGLCAGAVVWSNTNAAVTVWGNDEQTAEVDGIKINEILNYRFWDVSAQKEVPAAATYVSGSPTYSVDGISVLGGLSAQTVVSLRMPVTWRKGNAGMPSVDIFDMKGNHVLRCSGISLSPTRDDFLHVGSLHLPKGNYVTARKSGGVTICRKISIVK
ncbi:MAG: hypothetical protein JXA18_13220 [Chitinispirillaceae bacterium]|nr:hypothetical protein [Chitinispirillaceae bacterium]